MQISVRQPGDGINKTDAWIAFMCAVNANSMSQLHSIQTNTAIFGLFQTHS